uniref:Alpha-amylase n=1 Tax=Anopheles dirus TaxID=7168 RepID=A0A182NIH1_9DIPT
MTAFRLLGLLLAIYSSNISIILGLQFGPFIIPSFANGGRLGFSGSLLSASIDPSSRQVSFASQAPQSLVNLLPPVLKPLLPAFGDRSKEDGTIPQSDPKRTTSALEDFSLVNVETLPPPNPIPSVISRSSTVPSVGGGSKIDPTGNRNDPHYYPGRHVMVHLFEWKFIDIAVECEKVLGPGGFGGVQVSPINEYVIAPYRPWWERYQPISYKIYSRSGDEQQFSDMVRRCQRAGIRIYVDVVVNHMAAVGANVPLNGTAGSPSDPANREYPAVPYNRSHFHTDCAISNYQNATEVRDCQLNGLPDLNQTEPYVRDRIVEFMNRLIGLGVAGFRMDASKHMWPEDMSAIYKRLDALNPAFGFTAGASPFIYQEVIDLGHEPVTASQYTDLGEVTEFKYSVFIGLIFRGKLQALGLQSLTKNNATLFGLVPSQSALVFVDNHDNQRGHGAGGESILTFKDGSNYVQAIAFTLATDYGTVRLMSSYNFTDSDQGPPTDGHGNILSPGLPNTGPDACRNGWICEHRWPVVRRLVSFRNRVAPEPLTDVQTTSGTFAFCRGNIGFAVFNSGAETYNGFFQTCLPPGEYCDIITGGRVFSDCETTRILVLQDSKVSLTLPAFSGIVLDQQNRVW